MEKHEDGVIDSALAVVRSLTTYTLTQEFDKTQHLIMTMNKKTRTYTQHNMCHLMMMYRKKRSLKIVTES